MEKVKDFKVPKINTPVEVLNEQKDWYPTHRAFFGQGGLRSVKDMTERDSIPYNRQEEGMICYVKSTKEYWRLVVASRDPAKVTWEIFDGGGGGGGGLYYTTTTPTTVTVGGVPAGSEFVNTPILEVIDQILHAYQSPEFTTFTVDGTHNLEVGDTFKGTRQLSWVIRHPENAVLDTIKVTFLNQELPIKNKTSNNTESVKIPEARRTSPGSQEFKITCENTENKTFSKTVSINWMHKVYSGVIDKTDITEQEVKDLLNSELKTSRAGTYTLKEDDSGYAWVLYPSAWGDPESVMDPVQKMNYAYSKRARMTITNDFGVTTEYIVIRSANWLGTQVKMQIS